MKKLNFDEAVERIDNGFNQLEILEKVRKSDKNALRDYLSVIGD